MNMDSSDDKSGFSQHGSWVNASFFFLQGTKTLGVFVQKGPGVKVHVGSWVPYSQSDPGTVVLELAGKHPTI